MNKERELLESCRMYLASLGMFVEHSTLINKIQELLAQPELTAEPVAWIWNEMFCDDWTTVSGVIKPSKSKYIDDVTPLYTAPPKREPFGPEERQRLSKAYSTRAEQVAFEEGIIFAEISYGIGGGE